MHQTNQQAWDEVTIVNNGNFKDEIFFNEFNGKKVTKGIIAKIENLIWQVYGNLKNFDFSINENSAHILNTDDFSNLEIKFL